MSMSTAPSSTLAAPSLLDPRRRTRSFNGVDSAPVVILPSLPAIHPPGVEEQHPRMPHPLLGSSVPHADAPTLTHESTHAPGSALRVPAATLRSKSPMGRGHPHPLPSPENDGLPGFAIELVHAAGSSLLHPYIVTRSSGPNALPGTSYASSSSSGGGLATAADNDTASAVATAGQVALPGSTPASAHSLRALAHQLAGPMLDPQPSPNKQLGPLAMHRETLLTLKDQLTSTTPTKGNVATTAFPPGLTKRFSAPSLANKSGQ